jgi:hypothetical protein
MDCRGTRRRLIANGDQQPERISKFIGVVQDWCAIARKLGALWQESDHSLPILVAQIVLRTIQEPSNAGVIMTSNTIAWWSRGLLIVIADKASEVRPVGSHARAASEAQRAGE